jgi:radical SAM-linked protein
VPLAPGQSTPPRQRWRARYSRDASAAALGQRDESEAWSDALLATGPPFVPAGERGRPRLAFGPPLPTGATARNEPLELLLDDRRTVADVRTALERVAPSGHSVRAICDIWLGAPALAGLVRAADYDIAISGAERESLADAVNRLLAAGTLPRARLRGDRTVAYDLRPLVADLVIGPAQRDGLSLRFRARVDPERGAGRPDEVVAALGELAGATLEPTDVLRTGVWLADEPAPAALTAEEGA